jgi:hypothetical protein
MAYFVRAPHPPSERRTDAGQLPPWLLGVAFSELFPKPFSELFPKPFSEPSRVGA